MSNLKAVAGNPDFMVSHNNIYAFCWNALFLNHIYRLSYDESHNMALVQLYVYEDSIEHIQTIVHLFFLQIL